MTTTKEQLARTKALIRRLDYQANVRINERIESLERQLEYERGLNAKLAAQIAEMQDVAR